MSRRGSWDDYFFRVAAIVSSRSTCPRASIGAVLVKWSRIIGTGYNGAPEGEPHCPETDAHLQLEHCPRARHAEVNALRNALLPPFGATLYVVGPRNVCVNCERDLRLAGVKDIRWKTAPPVHRTLDLVIREVNAWQAETFPRATPASVVEHLRREVQELVADPTDTSELADVVFLAVGLAYELGVDLTEIVDRKLAVNRARTWGEPDADGVVEHVREVRR